MPTGFHPNTHFFSAHLELAVELLRFLAVPQFPFVPFPRVRIDKRNLLEARVIVTTYNDHVRLLSPEPWLVSATKVYSGVGADIVMESSHSIDNCARVSETVPLVACGQTKRPRSSRLANRHNPSPSYQRTLIRSPRRPRNTNTCPENGFSSSLVSTSALSPVKPRRRSVTPAAIQIHVLAGSAIIAASTPATRATTRGRRCLRCALARVAVQCESCPACSSQNLP